MIVDEATLTVLRTDEKGTPIGETVAVTTEAFTGADLRTITLRPKKRLEPQTHYQVRATVMGEPSRVLGRFSTGTAADASPPTWAGAGETAYRQRAEYSEAACQTGDPHASIELVDAEKTADADIELYGIWRISKKAGTFDPASPPTALVSSWKGRIYLGRMGHCYAYNFDFPYRWNTQSVTVWIAPMDAAGNIGKPARVVIDVSAGPPWPN